MNGPSCICRPSVPAVVGHVLVAVLAGDRVDGDGDVAQGHAGHGGGDPGRPAPPRSPSRSRSSPAVGGPMWTVTAPSPCQPSTIAPQSTESRSPSLSRRPLGRPAPRSRSATGRARRRTRAGPRSGGSRGTTAWPRRPRCRCGRARPGRAAGRRERRRRGRRRASRRPPGRPRACCRARWACGSAGRGPCPPRYNYPGIVIG